MRVLDIGFWDSSYTFNNWFYDSQGQYDADKEVLIINTFWGKIPISIPIDEAKDTQNNIEYIRSLGAKFFIQNDQLALLTVYYRDYKYENPSRTAQVVRNKRLELEQIARNKRLELERLDSLELATYNQKLDSIAKNYNRQLLQNPYNLNQETLGYGKITEKDTQRESNFNKMVSSMKSRFEYLNNRFSEVYESAYWRYGEWFASEDEFDAFYKQGKDIYSQGIRVLNYLTHYSQSRDIAEMSFRFPYQDSEKEIFSTIRDCQGKPYYPQVIDFVIKTNKLVNYEWSRNGKFFESKTEFYHAAYLSGDYKNILKTNKKTLKANKKK